MLSFVVAIAKNNVIGKDQRLAWHLPNDLKKFKQITLSGSKTLIMGRKTFESLPKMLTGRKHIILTRNRDYKASYKEVQILHSIDDIMPYVNSEKEYFVIGGAQIFKLLLPYTKRMYLTEIHENIEGDTFFPNYNKSEWKVTKKVDGVVDEENKYNHTFLILDRIK